MPVYPLKALKDNYIWSMSYADSLIVVDPGMSEPVFKFIDEHKFTLTDILITHHHYDHTDGISKLLDKFPHVNIYAPHDNRIEHHTVKLKGGEFIELNGYSFKVIHTPGHTLTHICYFEPDKHWLFCGDTLFSAGCGRLFEGSAEQLYDSLKKLRELPPTTNVFAGHEYTKNNLLFAQTIEPDNMVINAHLEYLNDNQDKCSLPSTIALEKEINPFLRTDSNELHQFAIANNYDPHPVAILKKLRELKDNF